jgi:hypothetical protein
MNSSSPDFCFCTLALGEKYRLLTKQLATDLATYSPGTPLIVGTDKSQDFNNHPNVITFKHRQKGILFCYYDRRFVVEAALAKFRAAIVIDADTRIVADIPTHINWLPGITAGHRENLIEHVKTYTPERLKPLSQVASKLGLPLEEITYIGESLYIIARDEGKEKEYLKQLGKIGNYLELNGVHGGDGNAMGLAAAKVGWTVNNDGWQSLKAATKHLDASYQPSQESLGDKLKLKLGYHYRLNKARLAALQDFNFYYR